MYEQGTRVEPNGREGSWVSSTDGDFVVVPRIYWEDARSRAILASDLMELGTRAVEERDAVQLQREREKARLATLDKVEEEKETYEKAFYRMRDRVVVLVRAIRGHRSAIRCGGQPPVTNARLWDHTRDYPGRD